MDEAAKNKTDKRAENQGRQTILLVEDSELDRKIVLRKLNDTEEPVYRVVTAKNIAEAQSILRTDPGILIVLLDLGLPDSEGLDTVVAIGLCNPEAAIVVLTGVDDEDLGQAAINHGAQDYLVKDEVDVRSLRRAVRYALERKRLTNELRQFATIDQQTGMFNRRFAFERGRDIFKNSRRYGRSLCIAMLDIDHFKSVNDTYGHAAGDDVLAETARLVRELARETDVVGRYGGEEFFITLPETDLAGALILAERIRSTVAQHEFSVNAEVFYLTMSIGIASLSDETESFSELIRGADEALYRAKETGRNQVLANR